MELKRLTYMELFEVSILMGDEPKKDTFHIIAQSLNEALDDANDMIEEEELVTGVRWVGYLYTKNGKPEITERR